MKNNATIITKPADILLHAAHEERTETIRFQPLDPARLLVDIIIPVYNEEHSLPACIEQLDKYLAKRLPYRYRITIADNGSTDTTWQVAQRLAGRYDTVRAAHVDRKGRGHALHTVWSASDADILAYMDVDLSTGLDSFLPMIAPLVRGEAALATGSRLSRESTVTRSAKREFISRCYNWIVRRSVRSHFSDAQCGFKAIRKDAARTLLPHIKDKAWFFDTELMAKAERRGWRVHEVPVTWVEDPDSRVKIIKTANDDLKGLARLRREFGMSAIWERPALAILLLATLALYTIGLSHNDFANSYYSAAVQAASTSWKAWFFGSLDAANFVTVDKPPVAIWFMGLSARLFGFSSFSMLLPSALAGVATVALLYGAVRRLFDAKSALIAGSVLALTPVAALMFRFNNPDSFLVLFLTASAYAFTRALENKRALLWLSLAGVATGFAFNTKMLQGLIVLPVMGMIYLFLAQPRLVVRIRQLLVAGVVTAVSTLWWAVIVGLVPAASRPYVGSSSKNSMWDLILGYNGFGRLLGKGQGMGGAGGMGGPGAGGSMAPGGFGQQALQTGGNAVRSMANAMPGGFGGGVGGGRGGGGPGGVGFGGQTGLLRMFNESFGPNIAWLLPLALICAGLTIWLLRRAPRDNMQRAAILLWTGWLVLHAVVFSITGGTIHPYYVIAMAPAVAALVGIGAPYLWKAYVRQTTVAWILPLAVVASVITGFLMLGYGNDWPWLGWTVLLAGVVASLALLVPYARLSRQVRRAVLAVAVVTVLAGPVAFTFTTAAAAHSGSIPTSGPSATALAQTNNESASADSSLVSYLLQHQDDAQWIVAVASANESAPIQISSGQPVMAVGGFSGSDNTLTLDQFKQLVRDGKIKYYAVSSGRNGFGGGRGSTAEGMAGGRGGMGGPGGNSQISSWVTANGTKVDYGGSGTTLYELHV